ncbi:MAG TPA: class I SAM-dependent methyltransferase family protein [Candidatus Bathyarchaeia archaeon]|nr:class I SAM-dependent methyltransferase family protein [Candidatus Bathyarchaeia archaeon]
MRKRLQKHLSDVLSPEDLASAYNSYDIIGGIAIFRLPQASRKNAQNIAKAIMSVHTNVKTVLAQVSPVAGDFRLRRLVHVAGENRTSTIHRESGCLFSVDVERCYFSQRLYHERSCIARLIKPNETVVNMFAGVGCFSIVIAKHASTSKVFSIDVNPAAFQFMRENIRLNRVYGKVIPLLGDSKAIIERRLQHVADRVLMPLPEKAFEYLPSAISALKTSGGWLHYYDFEHAEKTENPAEKTKLKVTEKLSSLNVAFGFPFSRVVRTTGPNWYQVVLDMQITRVPDKF